MAKIYQSLRNKCKMCTIEVRRVSQQSLDARQIPPQHRLRSPQLSPRMIPLTHSRSPPCCSLPPCCRWGRWLRSSFLWLHAWETTTACKQTIDDELVAEYVQSKTMKSLLLYLEQQTKNIMEKLDGGDSSTI